MTAVHEQVETLRLRVCYPEHPTRERDPHYAAFAAFERRSRRLGLDVCAVKSDQHAGGVQCHHSKIEFSLQNGVDIAKFDELYGLHLADDEEFRAFVESPGNAEWLCLFHHIGAEGVHVLPEPVWAAVRVAKDGERVATALRADGTPLHQEAQP